MIRHRLGKQRTLLVSLAAVVAVACGGAEDDADADPLADSADAQDADGTGEDDTGERETGASDEDDTGAPDEDNTGADDPAGVDDDPDAGPSAHRPADDAVTDARCDELADGSPGAVIAFPADGDEAGVTPVTVEVAGCSDTFESNLQYEAFHGADSTATLDGFTSAGTLGDWAPFSFEETFWTPGEWRVVVFVLDAESGNRVEYDDVTFVVAPD